MLIDVSPTDLKTAAKYDSRGNLIESTDTDGLKTTYTYNARGQLLTQTAPDGQVTKFEYDAAGNIKRTVDSRGNTVDFDYNPNGRIETATTTFTLNGQTHTLKMEYDYDNEGRTVATRTSQGNNQSVIYDATGRVKSTTDIFGNVTNYRYDLPLAPGENTTPIAGVGRAVTRIDEVTLPDNTPTNSSDNPKVINKYDAANNLIAQISPTGLETRYVYDDLHRLTETILPDTTPADWTDNPRTKTEYSDGNRIKSQTDILGNKTQYFYNDIGQIDRVLNPFLQPTTYTYNAGGQVETVTDYRNRKTQFVYDDKARVKEVIYFDNSRFKLTYDELGRVKTETNELNQTTTYEYDAKGRVKAVINAKNERTEFEYDHRDNLVRVTDSLLQTTTFKYDEYGQRIETTFHNSDKVAMAYDRFGRLTKVTDENLHSTEYTYDNLSQLTQIEQPQQVVSGQLQDTFTKYTYDNLSRLQKVEDANTKVTEFKYDEFNRPWQTILPLGQSNRTDYNKFGQVTATTDFNGDKIDYSTDFVYDAFGNRVASIDNGVRTNYLVASTGGLPNVLMEYDAANQVTADYTYGLGLVSATRNNREGFYHTDAIGSTRSITDSVGLVTDRYTYDAFGGLLNQTGTFGNSFQFGGEQRDISTGLDYMRARYYDPSLGRFISKDPFAGFLSDPYSQHDYQYAHANPVRFTDPTGYFSMQEVMGTIATASSLAAIGGVGFGGGYIAGAALDGASGEEILGMFGDWGAGFASGVSGGYLTDMYEHYSGNKVEPTHGMLWGAGNVTGIGVSFLLGMKLPLVAKAAMGPLKWVATAGVAADTGFDVYGAATATQNLYDSYQDNGGWEFQDSWNLLAYLPFVGMMKGVKQGINVSRKTPKLATPGADDLLANSKKMDGGAAGGVGNDLVTLESSAGMGNIGLPRTPGLGDTTTMEELLRIQGVPALEGVVLTDKFVRFSDMWKLTEATGMEYLLTKENGNLVLRSGAPNGVSFPPTARPIAHTHPKDILGVPEPLPSDADIKTLNQLWGLNPNGRRPHSTIIWGPNPGDTTQFRATEMMER